MEQKQPLSTTELLFRHTLEKDFPVTVLSGPVEELTGFGLTDFQHDEDFWWSRIHPEDRTSVSLRLSHYRGEGEYYFTYRWLAKDNSYHWFCERIENQYNSTSAEIICSCRSLSDLITKSFSFEQVVFEKNQAQTANEQKTAFFNQMSHELRTPLSSILGFVDIFSDTETTDEQKRFLQAIKESGEALLSLVNNLLDIARVESGKVELEESDFSLRELIGSILASLLIPTVNKKLELLYHVSPDVPDWVIGDHHRFRQILNNLIGNAIKFTNEGNIVVRVTLVSFSGKGVRLKCSVADSGIGIPNDKQSTIFSPFSQAEKATSRKYGGTGLGLTIVRHLVELMNGEISVESSVGKGSTFTFTFEMGVAGEKDIVGLPGISELKTLIVDDNSISRELFSEMLESYNITTKAVGSGEEALREIESSELAGNPFSLILLDINLPGIDGFEVAKRIVNGERSFVPGIIVVSLQQTDAVRKKFAEIGIDTFFGKPFQMADLMKAVQGALKYRSTQHGPLEKLIKVDSNSAAEAGETFPDLNILVVDDDKMNRQIASTLLEKMNLRVVVAESGCDALVEYQQQQFDMILMDINLPDLNGYEVTARIRAFETELKRYTPIIAVTANAMSSDRAYAIANGMNEVLAKPFRRKELREMIRRFLPIHQKENSRAATPEKVQFEGVHTLILERMDGNTKLLADAIDLFLSTAKQTLSELRVGIESNALRAAELAAHTIKGRCLQFSSSLTAETAGLIENACKSGNQKLAHQLFPLLEHRMQVTVVTLEILKKKIEAQPSS